MCPKEKLARAPKRLGINRITSYLYHNVSKSVCVCVCVRPFYSFFCLSIHPSTKGLCVCIRPFFSFCLSIHPSTKGVCDCVCVSALFFFLSVYLFIPLLNDCVCVCLPFFHSVCQKIEKNMLFT